MLIKRPFSKSLWRDLPLRLSNGIVNAVIEIPRDRLAKLELDKRDPGHQIIHTLNKNRFDGKMQPRYYAKFPVFNYGFIPQTWEDPFYQQIPGKKGDDDPLDLLEMSGLVFPTGSILHARVLGSVCLIDQDEVDWKVMTMQKTVADLRNINSLKDFLQKETSSVKAAMDWFKDIKTWDGKKRNHFHYEDKIFDQSETVSLINRYHQRYNTMLKSPPCDQAKALLKQYHLTT